MRRHIVIPDCQVTPDTPTDHLEWIGKYIVEMKPDVVVNIGDFADMESLSSYDKGKKSFEGRRYKQDIEAANAAMDRLMAPLHEHNAKMRQWREKQYKPELHLTLGNHEYRINRAVENQAELEGILDVSDLNYADHGWVVHDFLKPLNKDGISYSHYFSNPQSGRPYSGESIVTRLKNIGFSFTMGHQQVHMVGVRPLNNGSRIRGLVSGSCLTPDHRVLTDDLRYVPLGEVRPGDRLVSFEEHPANSRKRGFKTGTVEKVKLDRQECFRVVLESGKEFKVTADHFWLGKVRGPTAAKHGTQYVWRQTQDLRVGSLIPRVFDEWEFDGSREAGYLSGMYDGEGTLYARPVGSYGGAVMQMSLSQKPGAVLDECRRILYEMVGHAGLTDTNQKGVCTLRVKGGAKKCARVLGSIRPLRLMQKFRPELLGSLHTNMNDKVVAIEPIGEQEIVRIAIDEKTMIVEGYPHHNCYLHDEDYRGHQANSEWRGIIVKNEVRHGDYDLMEVSLDFLCRKYEGCHVWQFMETMYPDIFEGSQWMKAQKERAMREAA